MFIVLISALSLIVTALAIQIQTGSLLCNGLATPLGRLPTTTPRLSWVPVSSTRGDTQTGYQVQASLANATVWDSGNVASGETSAVYAGKSLSSRDRVFWRVRAWDVNGTAGPWSEATWFELALMDQSDWKAQWITNEHYVTGSEGLPIFAKSFAAPCDPDSARLYSIGLGVQWATLNGVAVSTDEDLLSPSYSTMNKTLFYSTYDVTGLVHRGENVLVMELGKGVYDAEEGLDGRYTKFTAAGSPLPLKALAQLEYTCNKTEVLVSDGSWQTTVGGPMLESSWYGGEEYDARREQLNAYLPGSNRSSWTKANMTTTPYPSLHPQLQSPNTPPLKIVETFSYVDFTNTGKSWVFDFGQNFAGWYQFNLSGAAGQRITLWPAELLLTNGSVDQSTTGSPIFDGFTFSDDGFTFHTLKFMYHGFRYLEVFGLTEDYEPRPADIVGLRIRLSTSQTGTFESDNVLFNSIHEVVDQAIQNQMYSVLTDCPHREKMGWLEQNQLAIAPALFGYNFRGFGIHMMKQMVDAQNAAGIVPTTAPQLTEFGSWPPWGDGFDYEPNWGVSIVLFALFHYEAYGDIEILEQNYDHMVAYINYLTSQNSTTHVLWYGLGDWEAIDQTTSFGITATSAYARGVHGLSKIAAVLGYASDAAAYSQLHSEILSAFHTAFFNATDNSTTYGTGSQASDAIALDIGAVPTEYIDSVYAHLTSTIVNNGTHVSVGEVGLPALFRALSSAGYNELLCSIMNSTTYPSYGYIVEQGATSMTEYWSGPEGTGSQDHIILDYGDTWLYGLAGLKQANGSIGWREVDFDPVVVEGVSRVNVAYNSVRGLVAASWERREGVLEYNITVPVGSLGMVYLPGAVNMTSLDGGAILGHPDVLAVAGTAGNRTTVRVGAGSYIFTAA